MTLILSNSLRKYVTSFFKIYLSIDLNTIGASKPHLNKHTSIGKECFPTHRDLHLKIKSSNKTQFRLFFAVNLNFTILFSLFYSVLQCHLTNIHLQTDTLVCILTSRTAFLRHLKHDLFIMHSTIFSQKTKSRKRFVRVLCFHFSYLFITIEKIQSAIRDHFSSSFTHRRTWKMIIVVHRRRKVNERKKFHQKKEGNAFSTSTKVWLLIRHTIFIFCFLLSFLSSFTSSLNI